MRNRFRCLAALLALVMLLVAGLHGTAVASGSNISGAVTQSYNAGPAVLPGMVVELKPKDPATVIPLTTRDVRNMLGVVTGALQFGACGTSTGLAKNAADSSSAAVSSSSYLYQFTNSSSAVASGVLQLNNGNNTGSALVVTANGNPASGQALIFASNTNGGTLSGNLIDLQSGGSPTSKFSVSSAGAVSISGGQSYTGAGIVNVNSGGATALNLDTGSTGTAAVTVGGTNATSVVLGSTANSTITQNVKSSSTAFTLQSSSTILLVDTSNTNYRLYVGPAAGSSTPPLLIVGNDTSSSDPTYSTAVAGAIYYNSATGNFRCAVSGAGTVGGGWQNCIGGLLTSSTGASTALSNCGSSGTACAAFSNGSVSIPASYCTPGRVIHIFASGIYSDTGSPNLDFGVYYGTDGSSTGTASDVLISSSSGLSGGTTQTNNGWAVDYYINCNTSGTSGTVIGEGNAAVAKTAAISNTAVMYKNSATPAATVNTTVAKNIYLFPLWQTANAANTVTCQQFVVTGM